MTAAYDDHVIAEAGADVRRRRGRRRECNGGRGDRNAGNIIRSDG
jgi:hypothetical protein